MLPGWSILKLLSFTALWLCQVSLSFCWYEENLGAMDEQNLTTHVTLANAAHLALDYNVQLLTIQDQNQHRK